MSAKRIFPPDDANISGSPGEWESEEQEDFGNDFDQEEQGRQKFSGGRAAKGRAAYAAHDYEVPPHQSRGPGFGPIGGLFADDAAGPSGHGIQSRHQEAQSGEGGNLLSVIAQDALEEECKKRVCPSCKVKKEADDAQLRALAELDNAKKRLAREREEQVRFAAESVLTDIIPSLDNLDLALQHAGAHEACKDFVVGVQMTRKLMQEALAKHGLTQTGSLGEEFNPAVHEAVGMNNAPDVPNGHVCSLLSSGYSLNGRLLRPARVMVCRK